MKYGYIHTFVLPLPKKNKAKYFRTMKTMAKLWMKHGALHYSQSIGDVLDTETKMSFQKTLKLKKNEDVVLGMALFKTKKHFMQTFKSMMADSKVQTLMNPDDFWDVSRMYWGTFKRTI